MESLKLLLLSGAIIVVCGCSTGNNLDISPQSDIGISSSAQLSLLHDWDLVNFTLDDGRVGIPADNSFAGITFFATNQFRTNYICDGGVVGTFTIEEEVLLTHDGMVFGGDVGCDAPEQDDVIVQRIFQSTFINTTSIFTVSGGSLIITTDANDRLFFVQSSADE